MSRIKRKPRVYRSGFEKKIREVLEETKIPYGYESEKLEFIQPAIKRKYTPDFIFKKADGTKMYLEAKGRLTTFDRQKMILVKTQHPDLDIRILFMRHKNPIRKGSKTTYGMWAEKHGFT